VQAKVDAVTGVMQKNIEMALKNTDRCVGELTWRAGAGRPCSHPAAPMLSPSKSSPLPLPPSRRIEDIDEKATVLADSAQKFKNAGTALKRKMRCRYYKIMIFFGFLVAAILAAIIAYFVQKKKTEDEQKAAGQ
jgi:hypothetical protein